MRLNFGSCCKVLSLNLRPFLEALLRLSLCSSWVQFCAFYTIRRLFSIVLCFALRLHTLAVDCCGVSILLASIQGLLSSRDEDRLSPRLPGSQSSLFGVGNNKILAVREDCLSKTCVCTLGNRRGIIAPVSRGSHIIVEMMAPRSLFAVLKHHLSAVVESSEWSPRSGHWAPMG